MSDLDEITKKIASVFENSSDNQEAWNTAMALFKENELVILNSPMKKLSDLSYHQFETLKDDPFDLTSVIKIKRLPVSMYKNYPLYVQMKALLDLISEHTALKLTTTGAIPPRYVKELHAMGRFNIAYFGMDKENIKKEADSETVQIARTILEDNGYIRYRNNTLSVTYKYKQMKEEGEEAIFKELINATLTSRVWAEYDSYYDEDIAQEGVGFSLYLLHKFGKRKRSTKYYADAFFDAFDPESRLENAFEFPNNLSEDELKQIYMSYLFELYNAYLVRTFERMFNYMGLITLEPIMQSLEFKIKATDAFYDLIAIESKEEIG